MPLSELQMQNRALWRLGSVYFLVVSLLFCSQLALAGPLKCAEVIQGNWSLSDNSRAYLDGVKNKNMTPEEAALNTWSGKQAVSYGFRYPKVVYEGPGENAQGLKVHQINVDFYNRPLRTGWRRFLYGY